MSSNSQCKWCGSDRHSSDKCPTLNLTRMLLDQPYEEEYLPDFVGVMTEEEPPMPQKGGS